MFMVINNGVARDFKFNGQRYFMGKGVRKQTEDRDFAMFMNNQRHTVVSGLEDPEDPADESRDDSEVETPDNMPMGALRHLAKGLNIKLARGDKAEEIKAKICDAQSE